MVEGIVSAMSGAVVGVVAFVAVKAIIVGQTTTAWSLAEIAIITIIPTALGLMTLISIFRQIK